MLFVRALWYIPLLVVGAAAGAVLAIGVHGHSGVVPFLLVGLVALLPFLLAALTGAAKTTTA